MSKYIIAERNLKRAKVNGALVGYEFRICGGPYMDFKSAADCLERVYEEVSLDAQTRKFDSDWVTIEKRPASIVAHSRSGWLNNVINEWVFTIVDRDYLLRKIQSL